MLTQKMLHEIYDYQDGFLIHKKTSNHVNIGDRVGYVAKNGYLTTKINAKSYLVHRLTFLWFNGYMPEFVDHVNCNKTDNRIENLRECTISQNKMNTAIYKSNSSGVKGVSYSKATGKWTARIQAKGKRILVGRFYNLDDAEKAIMQAREILHNDFLKHK